MDLHPASESNDAASTVATDPLQKHPVHYSGVLVILKVEETLFRVEKSLLCQFDVFRDMFESASAHLEDKEEGTTDENPIILQGLTAIEMESLLQVINTRWFKGEPPVNPAQWKAVVRLATMWEHEQLRQFAIDKIDELDISCIELFDLGMKCRVEKWLKPALVEMCLRPSPLDLEEAERLGTRFFVELSKIREKCLTTFSTNASCPSCGRNYTGSYTGFRSSRKGRSMIQSVAICNCYPGRPSNKSAMAENMVQSLIDSGLRPLLEDTRSQNPAGKQSGRHSIFYSGSYTTFQVGRTLFRTEEAVLRQFRGLADILDSTSFNEESTEILLLKDVTELEMAATLDVLEAR
ncbi:hypothetical protein FRC02_001348 [Tulasnella sp. 418]|nr:hypothetical protein FRC02_001348 [Tulasnella sp. 418]